MNPTLHYYDTPTACPKCGVHTGLAKIVYVPEDPLPPHTPEHLQRNCPCGFVWAELCKDSQGDPSPLKTSVSAFACGACLNVVLRLQEALDAWLNRRICGGPE